MVTYETIQGKGITDLLTHLLTDRTLVRFEIPKVSLDGLTIIRELRKFWNTPYLLIDVPDGLWKSTLEPKTLIILFEFTGRDKLKYRFSTSAGKHVRDEIWLRFPDAIERMQQRESFRIQLREKATIVFSLGNESRKMNIVNFSEGGAFAEFRSIPEEMQVQPIPKPGGYLYDIELVIPHKDKQRIVKAERVMITRVTEDTATGRYLYGLQFTDIKQEEKSKLNRLIWHLQRDLLRKRRSPQA